MSGGVTIGGAPVITLKAQDAPPDAPAILEAHVLPGRGMMLLQAKLRLPSGEVVDALYAPPPEKAAQVLDGGPDDFAGNKSFSFGGAILAPYANRIRGAPVAGAREIETTVAGHRVRLPRNWGGKAPGAEQYAMHGLILAANVPFEQAAPDRVSGVLDAGDFGGRWPGRLSFTFEWRLSRGGLELRVEARNAGEAATEVGIGWHPYFALPSGDRRQARVRLPAEARAEVNEYDEVLPTGRLLPLAGTAYDFNAPDGAVLGELYLDDCFTELRRPDGAAVAEVRDPASRLGLRVTSPSRAVNAIQVYAPPDKGFVVLEPQFNLADPFGAEWKGLDTGMARLEPGASVAYEARLAAFAVGNP